MANFDSSEFLNKDGLKIHCYHWNAKGEELAKNPKHFIQLVHGAGEHLGRASYHALAEKFVELGFTVYGHDHLGHGKSEGRRMDLKDTWDYTEDVVQHAEIIKDKFPQCTGKHFILGHSMGGMITLLTMKRYPDIFDTVILSSPALAVDPKTAGPWQIRLVKVFGGLLPHLGVGAFDPNFLSHDPDEVRKYVEDPLVFHGKLMARWSHQLLSGLQLCEEFYPETNFPFIIVHGTEDKMTNVDGSRNMYKHSPSADKTLKLYDGGFHELFNEIPKYKDQVHSDLFEWVTAQLK
eukprot:Clim_evm28s167 gene=Clim_evmTU28s167